MLFTGVLQQLRLYLLLPFATKRTLFTLFWMASRKMQHTMLAECSKEELRLKELELGQERDRTQALEGHAEALAADVERLCVRLQVCV